MSPISACYKAGASLRNFFYNINLLKKTELPAYVISIGNLTTGGTGKTPITAEIAKYIKQKLNKNTAILSHGYGGQLSVKGVNIISDGKNIYSTSYMAGDEPYWMALNTKEIPVITGKNRINSGKYAIEKFNSEVLILDDGFQHVKLHRNLNILVIDCCKRFGNNALLPAGPLREPISEIKRADKIILVNKKPFDTCIETNCVEYKAELEAKYKKPVYLCQFKSGAIYNVKTSEAVENIKEVYSFAGIAQPEFFFNYLEERGIEQVYKREFSDHHLYSADDLKNIINEAKKLGAGSFNLNGKRHG
ncbi:MAG: tetraacyldisaccharide 4'-kinase [Sphingobacterium sp.]|nr:tetraacyldisaccharide 4'-kinase [Sphingobacterium sp.]